VDSVSNLDPEYWRLVAGLATGLAAHEGSLEGCEQRMSCMPISHSWASTSRAEAEAARYTDCDGDVSRLSSCMVSACVGVLPMLIMVLGLEVVLSIKTCPPRGLQHSDDRGRGRSSSFAVTP